MSILTNPINVKDTDGSATTDYADKVTLYAKVTYLSGVKLFRAQQYHSEAKVEVVIQYRRGVDYKTILEYGDKFLEVLMPIDTEERHEELILTCREVVERGDS